MPRSLLAALAGCSIAAAGCLVISDFPGYTVWVTSTHAEPVVVVALGGPPASYGHAAAWEVAPGDEVRYAGFVQLADPPKVAGELRVFTTSCQLLYSAATSSKGYVIKIDADGSVSEEQPGLWPDEPSEVEVASTTCDVFGPTAGRAFTVDSAFPAPVLLRVADDLGFKDFLFGSEDGGSLLTLDDDMNRRIALLDAETCQELDSTNLPDVSALIRIYPNSPDEDRPAMSIELDPFVTGNGSHGTSSVCSAP